MEFVSFLQRQPNTDHDLPRTQSSPLPGGYSRRLLKNVSPPVLIKIRFCLFSFQCFVPIPPLPPTPMNFRLLSEVTGKLVSTVDYSGVWSGRSQGWFGNSVIFGRVHGLTILLHNYPQPLGFFSIDLLLHNNRMVATAPDIISSYTVTKGGSRE